MLCYVEVAIFLRVKVVFMFGIYKWQWLKKSAKKASFYENLRLFKTLVALLIYALFLHDRFKIDFIAIQNCIKPSLKD